MRELAAETLIECQTSNQFKCESLMQWFRHCNRFAFHFYFIWHNLDKSQHILFHLLSALILFFVSTFCCSEFCFLTSRMPNTLSHNSWLDVSLLPNSRPQAIEFNVYVFVTDGGGDYTSTMAYETTSHCCCYCDGDERYIFQCAPHITYNDSGSGSGTQWKFIVRFSYLRSPSSKSLFNVCARRSGYFFLLCVCVFVLFFVFVVNKCRIWVFAWLMRARDSSWPLVLTIPAVASHTCLLAIIQKPLHHFATI